MASENIGPVYITKIPGLADSADIQAAFRLYHYGVESVPSDMGLEDVIPNSVAGHLKQLQETIDNEIIFSATEPTSPQDGSIWVYNGTSPVVSSPLYPQSIYTNEAPTENLVDGLIWVDKDSSPLKMYVYDSTLVAWREIGA